MSRLRWLLSAARRPHPVSRRIASLSGTGAHARLDVAACVNLSPAIMLALHPPEIGAEQSPRRTPQVDNSGILVLPDATLDVASAPILAEALARRDVTFGLPADTPREVVNRWRNAVRGTNASVTMLADAGWERVAYSDLPTQLEDADLPAELTRASRLVVAARAGSSAIAPLHVWQQFAHPNTRLRARFDPELAVELSLAHEADYLIVSTNGELALAASTRDRVAARLIAAGLERLKHDRGDAEMRTTWEDRAVQRLVELGAGIALTDRLALRVWLADNASKVLAERIAEQLGVPASIEVLAGDAHDGRSRD